MLFGAFISMSVSEFKNIGDRLLVIFDGRCGLCNRSVRWLLKRDRHDRLRFVTSDAPVVAQLLVSHGVDAAATTGNSDTILVAVSLGGASERLLVRSDAVLATLGQLPVPWPGVAAVLNWVPRGLRDLGYRVVVRWRYRLFGRLEACPIPTAAERERFL